MWSGSVALKGSLLSHFLRLRLHLELRIMETQCERVIITKQVNMNMQHSMEVLYYHVSQTVLRVSPGFFKANLLSS